MKNLMIQIKETEQKRNNAEWDSNERYQLTDKLSFLVEKFETIFYNK